MHGTFRPVILCYSVILVVTQLTWKNTREWFGKMVAILDYLNLDLDLFFAISKFNS